MMKRPLRFSSQVLLMQVVVLLGVCAAGIALMAVLLRQDQIHQYEARALDIARSVAADTNYSAAIAVGDPDGEVQARAEGVRRRTGAQFVVVTDARGIRYSHPDRALLGKQVASDQTQALDGREVSTFGSSAAGTSTRGKVPLRAADGKIIGEVIVALPAKQVDAHVRGLLAKASAFLASAVALGAAAAVFLTRRLRRQTMGLDPARLRSLWEQQAALRRVATLVARGAPLREVGDAVSEEVGHLLGAHAASLQRYETDGTATIVAIWAPGGRPPVPVGTRVEIERVEIWDLVWQTGRSAREEPEHSDFGVRSGVGAPILVEGRLWGVLSAAWTEKARSTADLEARLAEFAELVATAISNSESRAELAASRARIVTEADRARRRIERDLHDGAQQRLISVGLELRGAEAGVPVEHPELKEQLARSAEDLSQVVDDLREISRGIHPAILSRGGLEPALKTLARRSAVPVELDVTADGRFPEGVEVAAYYVVSEALTNAARHAGASVVHVSLGATDGLIELRVHDDGVGGADPARGSGLIGLCDRVEALGGAMEITSPSGRGTSLLARIPAVVDP